MGAPAEAEGLPCGISTWLSGRALSVWRITNLLLTNTVPWPLIKPPAPWLLVSSCNDTGILFTNTLDAEGPTVVAPQDLLCPFKCTGNELIHVFSFSDY